MFTEYVLFSPNILPKCVSTENASRVPGSQRPRGHQSSGLGFTKAFLGHQSYGLCVQKSFLGYQSSGLGAGLCASGIIPGVGRGAGGGAGAPGGYSTVDRAVELGESGRLNS